METGHGAYVQTGVLSVVDAHSVPHVDDTEDSTSRRHEVVCRLLGLSMTNVPVAILEHLKRFRLCTVGELYLNRFKALVLSFLFCVLIYGANQLHEFAASIRNNWSSEFAIGKISRACRCGRSRRVRKGELAHKDLRIFQERKEGYDKE